MTQDNERPDAASNEDSGETQIAESQEIQETQVASDAPDRDQQAPAPGTVVAPNQDPQAPAPGTVVAPNQPDYGQPQGGQSGPWTPGRDTAPHPAGATPPSAGRPTQPQSPPGVQSAGSGGAWQQPGSGGAWQQPMPHAGFQAQPPPAKPGGSNRTIALVAGGLVLVIIAVLGAIFFLGGDDPAPEPGPNPPPQEEGFAPKSQTTFSGDALALIPTEVNGIAHNGEVFTSGFCRFNFTSRARAIYRGAGDDVWDLFTCLYVDNTAAQTYVSRRMASLINLGWTKVKQDQLTSQDGTRIGMATIVRAPDEAAVEEVGGYREVIFWSNGNLGAQITTTREGTVEEFFNALQF